jgi:hypothetical protein
MQSSGVAASLREAATESKVPYFISAHSSSYRRSINRTHENIQHEKRENPFTAKDAEQCGKEREPNLCWMFLAAPQVSNMNPSLS